MLFRSLQDNPELAEEIAALLAEAMRNAEKNPAARKPKAKTKDAGDTNDADSTDELDDYPDISDDELGDDFSIEEDL